MPELDRRTALLLLGGAVGLPAGAEQAKFFTAAEHALIDRLAEMILPADEHSPGAHDARVADYIDLVVASSAPEVQNEWRSRLRGLDGFLQFDSRQQSEVLQAMAARQDQLFAELKKLTLAGYYTSRIGVIQELGYEGGHALGSFPGCPHTAGTHR